MQKDYLEKQNANLSEQIQKYALAFTEEKKEKQELLTRYNSLEDRFLKKVEEFSNLKGKFYLWLGLLGGLLLGLIALLVSNLFSS